MEITTKSHIDQDHADSCDFPVAESNNGLFTWNSSSPGNVAIDCNQTGLPDNTMGQTGKFSLSLQYPDEQVSIELIKKAREFVRKVKALKESRKQKQLNGQTGSTSQYPLCPKCQTVCYGDCGIN